MTRRSHGLQLLRPDGPAKKAFKSASRQQESLLSPFEKRVLIGLARRLPPWVNSDHLTMLGFLGMILSGLCYYLAKWNPLALAGAVICLSINWFGDSLDGTLARFRDQQRPRYGFYVDHVCDVFGAAFLMLGLALSGFCDWRIALGMLLAFLLLSAETYLASYTLGAFKMSYSKFGPTELRLLLIAGTIRLMIHPMAHFPAQFGVR